MMMTPEWKISQGLTPYPDAVAFMESRVDAIIRGEANELIWLVEHPPLYTGGTSAKSSDLLSPQGFPVYASGRGGEYTYHGPGQRVVYVMLDLKRRERQDVRAYVGWLEQWIIRTLSAFDIQGMVREGRVGVWVEEPSAREAARHVSDFSRDSGRTHEAKIAAIGIRLRKWVSYHGFCINVHSNLSHYAGIVPCGIREFGVTSLHALGHHHVTMEMVDRKLKECLIEI